MLAPQIYKKYTENKTVPEEQPPTRQPGVADWQVLYAYKQHVCTIIFVTMYGSMLDAGRRSSK
jgi:hypothetical protein